MGFASIPSAIVVGVDGHRVSVEVHVGRGLPGLTIVGLPDASCREARDRVRAALLASGASWPNLRITVNLAPSSTRKIGSALDLAIAVGVLVAADELKPEVVAGMAFLGELGLDGTVRSVPGVVPMVDAVGTETVVVPVASATDAELVEGPHVRSVATLGELLAALDGTEPWPDHDRPIVTPEQGPLLDLRDVRGQPLVRKALEIAAAGSHHLLMIGPPGAFTRLTQGQYQLLNAEMTEADATLQVWRALLDIGVAKGNLNLFTDQLK